MTIFKITSHILLLFDMFSQNSLKLNHLFLCSCGAESLTFPGRFLAKSCSFMLLRRSFSRAVVALSVMNMFIAVFTAFPRLLVPGVAFTLNFLQTNKTNKKTFAEVLKEENSSNAKTFSLKRKRSSSKS